MDTTVHNKIVSFIWSIADDCLRDVYVRGKYRDVILPMVVLRRLDALLEPSKDAVTEEVRFQKEEMKLAEFDKAGLEAASGHKFYNTSPWTLQRLYTTGTNNRQLLLANFEEYLNSFSPNVQEIIGKFKLRAQVRHMGEKNVLYSVLEKFTSPWVNLSTEEKEDPDGRKMPPLTNLGMGYVFEELIRKFNEDNNEEAGEHFTPREVIQLMTHLIFDPIKDDIPVAMSIYDPACGSGGMLTEAQNFINNPDDGISPHSDVYLFGKEINDETYAICKADMMIKGNDPENIRNGSTLSVDEFATEQFDFMMSNPPYGKSWASEVQYIKDGKDVIDPRFKVWLKDAWGNQEEVDATPRSSDGQLLFLMEMADKMKPLHKNPRGSRVASVHNGSSLFTGDAGGGESNIRRYLIENDWLEAIIQLPNNLFYNTGITTYIWLLNNAKPAHRQGKVQLIDAGQLYRKLRKNLGNKNCEFAPEHIAEILAVHGAMSEPRRAIDPDTRDELPGIAAQVFDNADFGYYKVTVDRPKRLSAQLTAERIAPLRYDKSLREPMEWAYQQYGERVYTELEQISEELLQWCEDQGLNLNAKNRRSLCSPKVWQKHQATLQVAQALLDKVGSQTSNDFNEFKNTIEAALKTLKLKPDTSSKNAIYAAVTWYNAEAEPVVKKRKTYKAEELNAMTERWGCSQAQLPDFGYYPTGKPLEFITYESESDLRDYENVPLKEAIYPYFLQEVRPHVAEAWLQMDATKIGYEISFNKYFYRHKPLRAPEAIAADILALEQENEGVIMDILKED